MATPMVTMPVAWSNKRKVERLRRDAYESLTRMLNRAVADTGANFSIWSALRTHADQVALFKANYTPAGRGRQLSTDRGFQGRVWKRKPGGVSVASPDLGSNHQDGLAVDIHPVAIQNWIKTNGLTYGWSWDEGRRVGEAWHYRYIPARDRMSHEGLLDHGAVQRVVGASVDDKIGTGTVKLIKAWQKANGLTADGKVGAATKAAMGLGKAPSTPAPAEPARVDGFTYTYARTDWDAQPVASDVFEFKQDVLGTYLHHPAAGDVTMADESVAQIMTRLRGYRADHIGRHKWKDFGYGAAVDMHGNSYEGRGLQMEVGSNGVGNNGAYTSILFMKGDQEPLTPAAIDAANGLLAQIRDHHAKAELIAGHREAPGVNTACPGDTVMDAIKAGTFSYDGKPYVRPPTVTPTVPGSSKLPAGKALLMALINAPDFPLLRTPGNRCYYGPASGPITSVSGKSPNSMNPGEITGTGKKSGAEGLKTWQKRMNARGYSLTVDGRYGDATEKACKNLQRLAGIAQDGKIGPDAFYAAWLLPVVS